MKSSKLTITFDKHGLPSVKGTATREQLIEARNLLNKQIMRSEVRYYPRSKPVLAPMLELS